MNEEIKNINSNIVVNDNIIIDALAFTQNIDNEDKEEEVLRAYMLKHCANQKKTNEVIKILRLYRKLSKQISNYHWFLFFKENERFNDFKNIKHIKSDLSERYKQTCQTQVVGTLKSYISNVQNRFRKIVNSMDFDEKTKMKLFYINKYQKWMHEDVLMKKKPIEKELIFLAKKIFKHLTKNHPTFSHCNMTLDGKVATLLKKEIKEKSNRKNKNKAIKFDYWLKLSTTKIREVIFIPLLSSEYFEGKDGDLKKVVQINQKEKGFTISAIKSIMPIPITEFKKEKLGLDIGMVNFIVTEYGDLRGKKLMTKCKEIDNITTKLSKNLQKQGKKLSENKRYNKLIRKIKLFTKNETGRIINGLIKQYSPKEIRFENLSFQGSNIGRKNNRLLHKFGKGAIEKKLESVNQTTGITVTKAHCAYSSQECPNCHYTDKKNRKSRDLFQCGCCGFKCHADVVGGKNLSNRSPVEFNVNLNKGKIFQLLYEKHRIWKEQRCHSSATDLPFGGEVSKMKKVITNKNKKNISEEKNS